jgi:BirA family transcriptional regulator, biotin operon repressor / biotin---[acetyl-CoA-carboxylase] ligase
MPYENVARELAGTPFASIAYVEETGSTNADASALLGDERFDGHTIVAEFQRQGAGRKGRAWEAMPNTSLLFTTILPRAIPTENLWLVPFWVAIAVRMGLQECGVSTLLQWPNDLLLGERKLGGILCQSRVTGAAARVACGVGINVRRAVSPFDSAQGDTEKWAFCEDVAQVDRAVLLTAILRAYDVTLAALDEPLRVIREWERAAEIPGRRYRVLRDGARAAFDATAQGLEDGGALRVVREDETSEMVEMADARVLR